MERLSLSRPILAGLILMGIALAFRLVDIFILRLDEFLGELILSKSLGFLLVLLFVWGIGHRLREIGFHAQGFVPSLGIALAITFLALALGYGVEVALLASNGEAPLLKMIALDPKTGMAGGFVFGLWLIFGNFINSFMEEGLFRGVMLPLFRRKLSFWGANWLQAFLFGLWHLPWAVKGVVTGQLATPAEIVFGFITNFVPQLLLGLVWGYLFLKTGNLWAPWLAHTLTNTTLNLLHTVAGGNVDPLLAVRGMVYTGFALVAMVGIKFLLERFNLSEVRALTMAASST